MKDNQSSNDLLNKISELSYSANVEGIATNIIETADVCNLIAQYFNELHRQLVPEPVAYMFQNEETGVTGFVEVQQVDWGFQENNPRLQIICPVYRLPPAKELNHEGQN